MILMLSFIMSKVVILKDCFHLLIAVYFGKKVDVDWKSHGAAWQIGRSWETAEGDVMTYNL